MAEDDLGYDDTAASDGEVTTTSARSMMGEYDKIREHDKVLKRAAWRKKPVMTFFREVALPSGLIGAASYGLAVAKGEMHAEIPAVISGMAWYPGHMVREPIARLFGKVHGSIENITSSYDRGSPESYFRHKSREIQYEGFSDGALTLLLITGASMGPTYVDLSGDALQALYDAGSYVSDIISRGVASRSADPALIND